MQPGSWLRMNGPCFPIVWGWGAWAGSSEEEQRSYKPQVGISKFPPPTDPWVLLKLLFRNTVQKLR